MERLVITNGRVIDPASGMDGLCNVYVEGGRVEAVRPAADDKPAAEGASVIDAAGHLVLPGLVDIHTHLRDPGFEYKETVETGCAAAAAGGFTTIACMPNTEPVSDNASIIRYILKKAEATGVRVYPVGAVTIGQRGERLTEMAELREAGCVAVSDDGRPVTDPALMRHALEYSSALGLRLISHSEDLALAAGGAMHEGSVSTRLGLPGIPRAAEDGAVARDITLAEQTGTHLHIAHISTRGSVELVRSAKARGVRVTSEATPHHLTLTDDAVAGGAGYDTNAKMNPPLRTKEDVEALRDGLSDGTVDCIATDHAPHSSVEKDVEFDRAAFGVVGLETSFAVIWGLVEGGALDADIAVASMTAGPARVLGLDAGSLAPGAAADIAIIDPAGEWTVDPSLFRSKSRNTPWAGEKMKGRVVRTISSGRVIFEL